MKVDMLLKQKQDKKKTDNNNVAWFYHLYFISVFIQNTKKKFINSLILSSLSTDVLRTKINK